MPTPTQLIYTDNPGTLPATYVVPASSEILVSSIFARFDGAAAGGEFVPTLDVLSQSGTLMARVAVTQTLQAGDSARVTWAPFLRRQIRNPGAPTAHVDRLDTSAQSIPNNTFTTITWENERWDTNGIWSAAEPTKLYLNRNGYWYTQTNIYWAGAAAGFRETRLIRQPAGAQYYQSETPPVTGNVTSNTAFGIFRISNFAADGDYIEVLVRQDSGGNLVCNAGSITCTVWYLGAL